MSEIAHHVPLTFSEGLAAVRRAALDPVGVPVKVVVGGVRAVVGAGATRDMIDSWRIESASGPAVGELAGVIADAVRGIVNTAAVARLEARYGRAGVVAGFGIASVVVAEDSSTLLVAGTDRLGYGVGRRLGTDMLGLAQQLNRSFGVIPDRWKSLALQPALTGRWWDAHDGAMAPGTLSGEEKWLAAAACCDALGDVIMANLYAGFLRRQAWSGADVEAGMHGRLTRMRKGLGPALRAVKESLITGLDPRRVDLAGADLPQSAVDELRDVASLARAMAVIAPLG